MAETPAAGRTVRAGRPKGAIRHGPRTPPPLQRRARGDVRGSLRGNRCASPSSPLGLYLGDIGRRLGTRPQRGRGRGRRQRRYRPRFGSFESRKGGGGRVRVRRRSRKRLHRTVVSLVSSLEPVGRTVGWAEGRRSRQQRHGLAGQRRGLESPRRRDARYSSRQTRAKLQEVSASRTIGSSTKEQSHDDIPDWAARDVSATRAFFLAPASYGCAAPLLSTWVMKVKRNRIRERWSRPSQTR